MRFEPIDFSKLNEADVREEIIAPLLRYLGYRSGTKNNVIREQSLRYPKAFIGRKNEKKDPLLRGTADYILEVNDSVRWVIEAKSPDVDISAEEIEQAYTYANHPEVRAVYFVIVNGRELRVFQTNQGPDAPPLLCCTYEQLSQSSQDLENLLGPVALLRDHPRCQVDVGRPIGPGLRSVVRITNGHIIYRNNSLNVPALIGLTVGIIDGAVERDEQGHLVAFLRTLSPYRALQELNERLGLAEFEAISAEAVVSVDRNNPTTFRSSRRVVFPAGERLLDLMNWRDVELPRNLTCQLETIATGFLQGYKFGGEFLSKINYLELGLNFQTDGIFEIHLA